MNGANHEANVEANHGAIIISYLGDDINLHVLSMRHLSDVICSDFWTPHLFGSR